MKTLEDLNRISWDDVPDFDYIEEDYLSKKARAYRLKKEALERERQRQERIARRNRNA
jgi:hypothetical protein